MIEEIPEIITDDKSKRSIKNRLGRLLMTTEFKNKDKKLFSEVVQAKDELYEAFCAHGIFDSKYVNRIFRLYADKDQDIRVLKPQLFFSKHTINIPEVPKEDSIKLTQYIKTLRFLRNGLSPVEHQIKSLADQAKTSAAQEVKELTAEEETYDTFHVESEKQIEHGVAKNHFDQLMEKQEYDWNRFTGEKAIMSGYLQQNNYQDFMIFALLGFHYFHKKNDVYEAFQPEQLKTIMISFDSPGLGKTDVPLGVFLKIIEHLEFYKTLFSV